MTQPAQSVGPINLRLPAKYWDGWKNLATGDGPGPYGSSSTYANVTVRQFADVKSATVNIPPQLRDHVFSGYSRYVRRMTRRPGTSSWFHDAYAPTRVWRTYSDGSLVPSYGLTPLGDPPFPLRKMVETKALLKLLDNNAQIAVMLAEAHQTAALYETFCKRVAGGVSAFRKASPKQWLRVVATQTGNLPRKNWKKIPSAWLELQYGWKPHMQDLRDSAALLSNRLAGEDKRYVHVRSRGKRPFSFVNTVVDDPDYTLKTYVEGVFRCLVELVYQLQSPFIADLNRSGVLNPALVVWEKLPYSFVVDWVVPIGSWLQAMTADWGYQFVSGYVSDSAKQRESIHSEEWKATTAWPGWFPDRSICVPEQLQCETSDFRRSVYTVPPVPVLYLKSPVSSTHVANATSLLSQSFRKR